MFQVVAQKVYHSTHKKTQTEKHVYLVLHQEFCAEAQQFGHSYKIKHILALEFLVEILPSLRLNTKGDLKCFASHVIHVE